MRYVKSFYNNNDNDINNWLKHNNYYLVSVIYPRDEYGKRFSMIIYEDIKNNEDNKNNENEEMKKFIIETVNEEVKAIREIYESFVQLKKLN